MSEADAGQARSRTGPAVPAGEPAPVRNPPPEHPEPIAIIYPSRTTGPGHVVGVVDDPRGTNLTCTCRHYLRVQAGARRGCWAMEAARQLLGLPEPPED